MAVTLRIKLTTRTAATLTFEVDGEWRWGQPERTYRDAEEPPQLESIRDNWSLVGGAILTPDGSTAGGWDAFQAALAVLDSPTDQVTKVEILRVEAGVETVEATLGPPTHEGFRIDRASCDGPYAPSPRSTHVIAFPIDLGFSALRVFARDLTLADGTTAVTGVVSFEQTIKHEWGADGLGIITADTSVETASGTDARIKARLLGALVIPGTTWSFDTNGPDGVDLTTIDADVSTNTTRKPRKALAFSRVRQWGSEVGTTSPNTNPGVFRYDDARSDDGLEILRVVSAEATGPGAEAWVRGKVPANPQVEETVSTPTGRSFRATWTTRSPKTPNAFTIIAAEITGGDQDFDYEPAAGGFLPVRFDGALLPWQLTLKVQVQRRGGSGKKDELPLPPMLRDVWSLDRNASSEGQPRQQEQVATADRALWVREASLVYKSAEPPSADPVEWLRANAQASVPSYYLAK